MRNICWQLVIFIILIGYPIQAQNIADGRYLADGTWQPRNQNVTTDVMPSYGGDWPTITDWGDDVRLTYFESPNAHNPEIAVVGDYVYVVWWYLYGDTINFVRSTDGGMSWEDNRRISELEMHNAVIPNISASGSHVYVVYKGGMTYQGVYLQRSTNYGATWLPTQALYITARNYGARPTIVSSQSNVYIVFRINIDITPPGDWDYYFVRSTDYGETWSDTMYVSDTTATGLGPDIALNNNGLHLIRGKNLSSSVTEILYNRSTDGGDSWEGCQILSHNDTSGSFWPQIAAWGDSNVIVSWTDYKYSPYGWTGDAFICTSTDNGVTWDAPIQMTDLHLVKSTDISADENGRVVLTYSDFRFGDREIFGNISYDGGRTWEGEERLSEADGHSIEPSAVISDGISHLAWADARQNPDQTIYEVYYKRGDFQTGIQDDEIALPFKEKISAAYPNPFNGATSITLNDMKGGDVEIKIYDIRGRLIRNLVAFNIQGGDKKAVWDATDNSGRRVSSGIYFARVETPQTIEIKKLLFLR